MVEKLYVFESPLRIKEHIEAYRGPGELRDIYFDTSGLPPRVDIVDGMIVLNERFHAIFSGSPEEQSVFEAYLRGIGLAPRETSTQKTETSSDEFNPFDPKTYPKI